MGVFKLVILIVKTRNLRLANLLVSYVRVLVEFLPPLKYEDCVVVTQVFSIWGIAEGLSEFGVVVIGPWA